MSGDGESNAMPDDRGNLSSEELSFVQGRLATYWQAAAVLCPVSRDNNWLVLPVVVVPPRRDTGIPPPYEEINYPTVPVMCNTCGYMMYFNAVLLGLYPQVLPQAPQEKI